MCLSRQGSSSRRRWRVVGQRCDKISETAQNERRKVSQTDEAYARLKAMIIAGEIGPADQIDANRLVEALALGRTPVREALLRLQTDGIVRIIPKRGVRIVTLSSDDITEIYQVITAVEIEAVRLLAMTEPELDQLAGLTEASRRMADAAQVGDREEWVLADESFHRALLELNPNRRLRDVGLLHRDLAQRAHFVALRLLRPEQLAESARKHKELVTLISSGDADAAVASHQEQRRRGAKMLVEILQQYRLSQL